MNFEIENKQRNSGQALVLVLLSLAVVLTLVLFVLARSVTDVAVSSRSEDAIRAFSAAEAGIEQALIVGAGSTNQIGNATFTSSVTEFASGQNSFVYPLTLSSGDTSTIWFVEHDSTGNPVCNAGNPCFTGRNLKVCWGREGTSASSATTPAIELSIFYESTPGNPATAKIARAAFDPYSARPSPNNFSAPDLGTCTINGENFAFQKTIDLSTLGIAAGVYNVQNGLQMARLRMFYNTDTSQKVGFDVNIVGNTILPSQGLQADSSGTAGESSRRLTVFQSWPEAPSVFDYAVYSSVGVSK